MSKTAEKYNQRATHGWPLSTYLDHTLIGHNLLLSPSLHPQNHGSTSARLWVCLSPCSQSKCPGYWAADLLPRLAHKTSTVVPRKDVFTAFLPPCSLGQNQEGRRNLAGL